MEWLIDWVRQLLHLIFLVLLLQLLLPDDNMKAYVKVVMGLVVLAALLQPLAGLIRSPEPFGSFFDALNVPTGAMAADEWIARGQAIGETARESVIERYEAAVAAQIEALVPLVAGVERANVARIELTDDGDVRALGLEVVAMPGASQDEVRSLLEKFFRISGADVTWLEREPVAVQTVAP